MNDDASAAFTEFKRKILALTCAPCRMNACNCTLECASDSDGSYAQFIDWAWTTSGDTLDPSNLQDVTARAKEFHKHRQEEEDSLVKSASRGMSD